MESKIAVQDTLPSMVKNVSEHFPEVAAQLCKDHEDNFEPTSFRELFTEVRAFASGLAAMGVKRGERIGFISDNRKEWIICDLAILGIGAVDVPRGCDSSAQEISFILKTTECRTVIAENQEQLEKIASRRSDLLFLESIIVIDETVTIAAPDEFDGKVLIETYKSICQKGLEFQKDAPSYVDDEIDKGKSSDIATIIFTSGTTGDPKGVVLSHGNFLHQIRCIPSIVTTTPGQICLSILPIWHSFERIMEYVILGLGCAIAYSKPVGSIMLADFAAVRPHWMAAVPRVWESIKDGINRKFSTESAVVRGLFRFFLAIGSSHAFLLSMSRGLLPQYKRRSRFVDAVVSAIPLVLITPLKAFGSALIFVKIQKKLGGRFIAGLSAGGSLSPSVSAFFSALGIKLLNGYGLTESAPLISLQLQQATVPETVGSPIEETAVRIVDENQNDVLPGQKGLILARGPQVMQGYYESPANTKKVLSKDGWLNTGDQGLRTHGGELVITGRIKDTIVLLGGENVEPVPIEQILQSSEYIEHAVVLGQDRKFLAALIVPDAESLHAYLKEKVISEPPLGEWGNIPEVMNLFSDEIDARVSHKNGFKKHERIFRFVLLPNSFKVERELSHKLEVRRHLLDDLYQKEIEELFR